MPTTITWATKTINIPQSYLTNIVGTLYKLDTEQFRLDLKSLEESEEGMPFPDTHRHNTEVTVAGVTYARTIEIINGYTILFEDGQYSVRLTGSNNNFFDVENGILSQNQVQIIPGNAAGLIKVTSGSGVTEQDKLDIADRVWDELIADHVGVGKAAQLVQDIHDEAMGKWILDEANHTMTLYKADGVTPLQTFNLTEAAGDVPAYIERIPA